MENQSEGASKSAKPVGIILTTLYFGIAKGLFSVLGSIPLLFLTGFSLSPWITVAAVATLSLGIVSFATCYGLWVLIEWGRKLAIAICAISIPLQLISLMIPGQQITSGMVVWIVLTMALNVLIIWYLLKDDVRSLFSEA